MKKLLILFIGLMLFATLVSAQGKQMESPFVKTNIVGLENAMLRVQNETQAQHLEKIMIKIEAKRVEQFQKFRLVMYEENNDGTLTAKGLGEAKLFNLIKTKYTYKYQVYENGTVERINRISDGFYTDLPELAEN